MTLDAHLPPAPAPESGAVPPLWTRLTRGWVRSPSAATAEPALGYESALPFTLGYAPGDAQAAADTGSAPPY